MQHISRLVALMDDAFRIPGTKLTFGLDPIIGLVPGLGDIIDYLISAFLLIAMLNNGASSKVVAKMILNISIDGLVGLIPFLGRFFDVFYKANRRNLVLAMEHYEEGKHQGSAWAVIVPVLLALLLFLVLLSVLSFYILKWSWMFLQGM